MNFKAFSYSDIGAYRKNQEDNLLVLDRLFVVSDGMGGHASGELASATVINSFMKLFDDIGMEDIEMDDLDDAVRSANRKCCDAGDDRGATCTAIKVDKEDTVYCVNVGDSRLYHIHEGVCEQVTIDQGRGHILYSFVGDRYGMKVDRYAFNVSSGDTLILCSDGVSDVMGTDDIARTVEGCKNKDVLGRIYWPTDPAKALTDLAINNNSRDNCTAIVITFD